MAIDVKDYPGAEAPSADYPHGRISDDDGLGNGTPINQLTNQVIFTTFMKMCDEAGVTPNGLPDNTTNGFQIFDALFRTVTVPVLQKFGIFTNNLGVFGSADITATPGKPYVKDRKIYLPDFTNNEIQVFSAYGAYLDAENFGSGILTGPGDIQIVGDKAYILHNGGDDVDVFTLSTGAHIPAEGFTLNSTSFRMFIVPETDRLYALNNSRVEAHILSTGAYQAGESFNVGGALQTVSDFFVVNDQDRAYVVNTTNSEIEVYILSTATLDTSFGSGTLSSPFDIFIIGDKAYISSGGTNKVYNIDGTHLDLEDFTFAAGNFFISDAVLYGIKTGPIEFTAIQQTFDPTHK